MPPSRGAGAAGGTDAAGEAEAGEGRASEAVMVPPAVPLPAPAAQGALAGERLAAGAEECA